MWSAENLIQPVCINSYIFSRMYRENKGFAQYKTHLCSVYLSPVRLKTFYVLNSVEHKICPANESQITNNCNFFLAKQSWTWKCLCWLTWKCQLFLTFSCQLAETISCSSRSRPTFRKAYRENTIHHYKTFPNLFVKTYVLEKIRQIF